MQTGFRSPTARAYPPRGAVHHLPDCSDRIEPDNYLGAGPAFGRNHRHAAYAQQRAVRSEPRHSPFGSLSPRTAAPQSTHGLSRPSARDHGAPPRSRRSEPGQRHRPPTQAASVKDNQHRVDLLTHEAGGSSRSPKCARMLPPVSDSSGTLRANDRRIGTASIRGLPAPSKPYALCGGAGPYAPSSPVAQDDALLSQPTRLTSRDCQPLVARHEE